MLQDEELQLPTTLCGRMTGALVSVMVAFLSISAVVVLFFAIRGANGFTAKLIASIALEIAVAAVLFSFYGTLWSITQKQWVADHLVLLKRTVIWIGPLGVPVLAILLTLV